MTTICRRLFPSWRIASFGSVASAVVGERLLNPWQITLPFLVMSLADFLDTELYGRRASFSCMACQSLLSR